MQVAIISDKTGNIYWIDNESGKMFVNKSSAIPETPAQIELILSRLGVLHEQLLNWKAEEDLVE
jgi:hypothetical protein